MRFTRIAVSLVLLWGSANDATAAGREADESRGTATSTIPPADGTQRGAKSASLIRTRNPGDHRVLSSHVSTLPDEGRLVTKRHEEAERAQRNANGYRRRRSQPQLNDPPAQREHIETPRIQARRRHPNGKKTLGGRRNGLIDERSQEAEDRHQQDRLRTITSQSSQAVESQERPETNMPLLSDRASSFVKGYILSDHDQATATAAKRRRQRRRLRRRNRQQQENQHNMHANHHLHTSSEIVTEVTSHDDTNHETFSSIPSHILPNPSLLSQNILLVRGHQTHLCWTVDNGRYYTGTLIVLDECNVANPNQYFVRENYSYDVETDSYSWLWRPVGWELESASSDGISDSLPDTANSRTSEKNQSNLYVVGHKYTGSTDSTDTPHGGRWRMVLNELPEGVTDPLTQVFWTISSPSHDQDMVISSPSIHGDVHPDVDADVDLMGMGQHAYSTRLFVTNEGDVAEVDAPVVLRTETSIHAAVERDRALVRTTRHGLDQFEEEVYQLNGHDRDSEELRQAGASAVDGGTVAGVILGKWSYIHVA